MKYWFEIKNSGDVLSPALLFYPDRIQRNIDQMINIAGSTSRLRPHVKTYKCPQVVKMQMEKGISKFKCATLAEAQMLAECDVKDILVAYPLVGPSQVRFMELTEKYPDAHFSVLIDHADQTKSWKSVTDKTIDVFIDLDAGMHRTGMDPENVTGLINQMDPSFNLRGFHVYDGHIREKDFSAREAAVDEAYKQILLLWERQAGTNLEFICGSSITFQVHAKHPDRTLSPGTTLLWDRGYGSQFTDLPFEPAAILMTRIVSKPGHNLLCLDLGYKAVALEMKVDPVFFPQMPDMEITTHSEEHLVIRVSDSSIWEIGEEVYGIPWHICPTVALHEQAGIVSDSRVSEYWPIVARKRIY